MIASKEYLGECLKDAYPFQCRAAHEKDHLSYEMIGTVPCRQNKNRLYDVYEDTEQNHWYRVRVITEKGIVSEYEAIFGHPESQRQAEYEI